MEGRINDNLIEIRQNEVRSPKNAFIAFVLLIALAIALYYVRTEVLLIVDVVGDSMKETLQSGDRLVGNMKAEAERNDVVVFTRIEESFNAKGELVRKEKILIKRVIAVGGDTIWSENGFVKISYKDKDGKTVTKVLDEAYVQETGITVIDKTVVPMGSFYVLGDNRRNSNDSRFFGAVEEERVIAVVTGWSIRHKDGFLGKLYGLL